jgi:hypothetical protein
MHMAGTARTPRLLLVSAAAVAAAAVAVLHTNSIVRWLARLWSFLAPQQRSMAAIAGFAPWQSPVLVWGGVWGSRVGTLRGADAHTARALTAARVETC